MNELISITLGKLLEDVAKKYPDNEAVKYTDRPYKRTWKQLNEECEKVAKGLLSMGIRKG